MTIDSWEDFTISSIGDGSSTVEDSPAAFLPAKARAYQQLAPKLVPKGPDKTVRSSRDGTQLDPAAVVAPKRDDDRPRTIGAVSDGILPDDQSVLVIR